MRVHPLIVFVASSFACGCGVHGGADRIGEAREAVVVCPAGPTVSGIDVSEWQQGIDWNAVAGAGYTFAITRIGDGLYQDPYFAGNWSAIQSVGMIRGAYLFYEPNDDPVAQANLVIANVGQLGP